MDVNWNGLKTFNCLITEAYAVVCNVSPSMAPNAF